MSYRPPPGLKTSTESSSPHPSLPARPPPSTTSSSFKPAVSAGFAPRQAATGPTQGWNSYSPASTVGPTQPPSYGPASYNYQQQGYGQPQPQPQYPAVPTPPQIQNPFAPPTGPATGIVDPEEAAQLVEWQSAYMPPDSSAVPKAGPGTPVGGGLAKPEAAAQADNINGKPKTVIRSGGGKTWQDESLLEWDPAHFRLQIGNLAGEVTDESLLKAFSKYTSVQKARVIRDKRTTKSKGYGFVSFSEGDDYFNAFREMKNKYIGSHPVTIQPCKTRIQAVDAPDKHKKGKGGKGGHGGGHAHTGAGVQKRQLKTKGGLKILVDASCRRGGRAAGSTRSTPLALSLLHGALITRSVADTSCLLLHVPSCCVFSASSSLLCRPLPLQPATSAAAPCSFCLTCALVFEGLGVWEQTAGQHHSTPLLSGRACLPLLALSSTSRPSLKSFPERPREQRPGVAAGVAGAAGAADAGRMAAAETKRNSIAARVATPKQSAPGPGEVSDAALAKAVGSRISLTTSSNTTLEGTLFTACPITNLVAINTAAVPSPGDFHVIPIAHIQTFRVLALADGASFETAAPPIARLDTRALEAREQAAIRKIREHDATRGKGVSKEAQDIFDALSRTYAAAASTTCYIRHADMHPPDCPRVGTRRPWSSTTPCSSTHRTGLTTAAPPRGRRRASSALSACWRTSAASWPSGRARPARRHRRPLPCARAADEASHQCKNNTKESKDAHTCPETTLSKLAPDSFPHASNLPSSHRRPECLLLRRRHQHRIPSQHVPQQLERRPRKLHHILLTPPMPRLDLARDPSARRRDRQSAVPRRAVARRAARGPRRAALADAIRARELGARVGGEARDDGGRGARVSGEVGLRPAGRRTVSATATVSFFSFSSDDTSAASGLRLGGGNSDMLLPLGARGDVDAGQLEGVDLRLRAADVAPPSNVHHPATHSHYKMSDSNGKGGIPAWQKVGNPETKSNTAEAINNTGQQKPAVEANDSQQPSTSAEDSLLDKARHFLQDESIRDSPLADRVSFLQSKGLSQADIDTAIASVPASSITKSTTSTSATSSTLQPTMASTAATPKRDVPPVITYPEFLIHANKPPPLITARRLLNTAYAAAGVSALIYGASKYLVTPMSDSLSAARHDLAQHTQQHLDKLNSALEAVASVDPATRSTHALRHPDHDSAEHDAHTDASSDEDPTELFHRDFGTQTADLPAPTPSGAAASTSSDEDASAAAEETPAEAHTRQVLRLRHLCGELAAEEHNETDTALEVSAAIKVDEHKVAALGLAVGQAQLVEDGDEAVDLGLHVAAGGVPEAVAVGLLEGDGGGLLQRRDGAVADARVGGGDVLDEVLGADEPADAPAGAVEVLAAGADGEGEGGNLGRQGGDAGEGAVVEAVVDLVAEDEDVVLDAQVADGLQLGAREDLADGVVRRVEHDHARLGCDGGRQLVEVDGPLVGRRRRRGARLGRVHGHVDDLAAGHLNVGDVLVEEGLEDNDLVAGLEEAHEGREHALVGASGDCDFGVGVDGAAKGGRVRSRGTQTHQTSWRWPATRAAGLKGSARRGTELVIARTRRGGAALCGRFWRLQSSRLDLRVLWSPRKLLAPATLILGQSSRLPDRVHTRIAPRHVTGRDRWFVGEMVACPVCDKAVKESNINDHLDSGCESYLLDADDAGLVSEDGPRSQATQADFNSLFSKTGTPGPAKGKERIGVLEATPTPSRVVPTSAPLAVGPGQKRPIDASTQDDTDASIHKKARVSALEKAAPLAERMRPKTLDEVYGQSLVGPSGVLRGLIEAGRVPSMILWGGPGTGKTTIARLIAKTADKRFVEINSTSSGVAECKKLFAEAKNELSLTGRGTIIFCDEIHRFSKSQQDVFLGPVEAGQVTLIGATTENPSFKVVNALLSRCRTFTLAKLTDADIIAILNRALTSLYPDAHSEPDAHPKPLPLLDAAMLAYLSAFADGDARTALNLLDLALDLSTRKPSTTAAELKAALTATLVYDRAGDQHYDTISAFHKSVRGSDPDATLYYLARMLQSGEDALYIARRMVVIASEDVGLAAPHCLPLAVAAHAAAERVGLPEARINLAHVAVALALAPKSTRAYRGLQRAMAALAEPGVAGLPVPVHLRNAPTRLMKEMGYGAAYKYNPEYEGGRVRQEYLPEKLRGRRFLEEADLGTKRDPELEDGDEGDVEGDVNEGGDEDERILFEDDFDRPDSSLIMD
ncbi:hypothetical protein FH972_022902 [Carpinus fangiana]|uniref:RRM domain-containing protein n=1 Tax=Carpinus fangiana TaxID=176857 RepID=A0A5N6KU38_9ROSI|nr:hypothetical protein FH972_022902 [Carpinus fangiana]